MNQAHPHAPHHGAPHGFRQEHGAHGQAEIPDLDAEVLAEYVPHRGADWGPMLTAAVFTVETERTIAVNIEGTRSEAIGRYALGSLQRIRGAAAGTLSAEDLAALDELLDTDSPHSILRRDDLAVRTERTVRAARRT